MGRLGRMGGGGRGLGICFDCFLDILMIFFSSPFHVE